MKNCLSIEQSAELIKRGVSADKASEIFIDAGEHGMFSTPKATSMMLECAREAKVISPIFSLADLLSLLPKEITVTMESYDVDRLACLHISSTNEKWYVSYKYEFEEREYWCKMFNSEELIDALYKLMIWAIAHNHVKLD